MTDHPIVVASRDTVENLILSIGLPSDPKARIAALKGIRDSLIDQAAALIAVVNNGDIAAAHLDIEIATNRFMSSANDAIECDPARDEEKRVREAFEARIKTPPPPVYVFQGREFKSREGQVQSVRDYFSGEGFLSDRLFDGQRMISKAKRPFAAIARHAAIILGLKERE